MNVQVPHYRTRLIDTLSEIGQAAWDALLHRQEKTTPFLSYAFLHALHNSGSASPTTGWTCRYLSLWDQEKLVAAMPLYEKTHSYGEYVFDWAWANAYHEHGLHYYPKLLSAVPFTPVEGSRLLCRDEATRNALVLALIDLFQEGMQSSCHILFPTESEALTLQGAGFLIRRGVQFHWNNRDFTDFDDFLASLDKKKRKNIRAERRKVQEADVSFEHLAGTDISENDWRFFKLCYDKTYAEHRSTPYLNLDFFLEIGETMPHNIHLVIAKREHSRIAASLLIHDSETLYGRYWGCLEHVPCLHFETAYYQALEFCIAQKIRVFEGGAQGEHKMARGFLPNTTYSAHLLREPAFAHAIADFLKREQNGITQYVDELNDRNPYKSPP